MQKRYLVTYMSKICYNTPMKCEIEKIKNFLKEEENILFGYLFGSCVNATAHKQSDVDIALYFKNYNFDIYADIVHRLEKLLHQKVDLVVLNQAKNLYLLETIIRESILLKDHPGRDDFELRKIHQVLDFKALNQRLESA